MTAGADRPVALEPPYYAVIFTSIRTDADAEGYALASERMMELAVTAPGFLGVESARSAIGITVSYWRDEESITAWKRHAEHILAQDQGRKRWYDGYRIKIARVEREYGFEQR